MKYLLIAILLLAFGAGLDRVLHGDCVPAAAMHYAETLIADAVVAREHIDDVQHDENEQREQYEPKRFADRFSLHDMTSLLDFFGILP